MPASTADVACGAAGNLIFCPHLAQRTFCPAISDGADPALPHEGHLNLNGTLIPLETLTSHVLSGPN